MLGSRNPSVFLVFLFSRYNLGTYTPRLQSSRYTSKPAPAPRQKRRAVRGGWAVSDSPSRSHDRACPVLSSAFARLLYSFRFICIKHISAPESRRAATPTLRGSRPAGNARSRRVYVVSIEQKPDCKVNSTALLVRGTPTRVMWQQYAFSLCACFGEHRVCSGFPIIPWLVPCVVRRVLSFAFAPCTVYLCKARTILP